MGAAFFPFIFLVVSYAFGAFVCPFEASSGSAVRFPGHPALVFTTLLTGCGVLSGSVSLCLSGWRVCTIAVSPTPMASGAEYF